MIINSSGNYYGDFPDGFGAGATQSPGVSNLTINASYRILNFDTSNATNVNLLEPLLAQVFLAYTKT